jgi:hypothetical protein
MDKLYDAIRSLGKLKINRDDMGFVFGEFLHTDKQEIEYLELTKIL